MKLVFWRYTMHSYTRTLSYIIIHPPYLNTILHSVLFLPLSLRARCAGWIATVSSPVRVKRF